MTCFAASSARGQGAAPTAKATVHFFDRDGRVLDEASGVGLPHTAPPSGADDEDAFSIVVSAPDAASLPSSVTITSLRAAASRAEDNVVEILDGRALVPGRCPAAIGAGRVCAAALPLRLAVDDVDRRHPLLQARSILAELGGSIAVSASGLAPASRNVVGSHDRSRATLRVRLVRMLAGGPTPIGTDAEDAVRLAREEIDRATAVWSSCGISFGPANKSDVKVVDPPAPFLLAVGCDAPAPASGGQLRVVVDGKEITVDVPAGTPPRGAARLVAAAVSKAGFRAVVSDNRASRAASLAPSDVLVSRSNGQLAVLSAPKKGAISSDATLDACIGRVDLDDGLQHFTDADAGLGTLEERTLVKAFDDGDPGTIEVFVVPSFGGDSRIGESFIFLERGAIRNVVIEDRAGLRVQKASFTLAHELGHVLLDQPGHPDDYAADTPTSLMDADAVNPTAFGPRRLSPAECLRAHTQSGEKGLPSVLAPWPVNPSPPSSR